MLDKRSIRAQFKNILISLNENIREENTQSMLLDNFIDFFMQHNINLRAKNLAGYYPNDMEIDDLELLQYCANVGSKILLPKINGELLQFLYFKANDKLIKNTLGILEPQGNDTATPDIILLPLLSFDDIGTRLGYGKGFYDKTIAKIRNNNFDPLLIGLAYSQQKFSDFLPKTKYDIPLHAVITQESWQIFSSHEFLE